ncbi:hypothetical protein [Scleromatobacter humisilvae]|uniref:Uncharacterized protein n=1 Tax=Scleromatobacter humisilvae TaxID=2897159 RepID=A0A9X1YPK5_9BURK|nr:hypothetical protein [Scleromatobacter humisilvae]MCK9688738.1 hypothetical protein [Scleromatobacter humisilvae]
MPRILRHTQKRVDDNALLLGRLASDMVRSKKNLHEAEFRVFSQFGDDGIIQWLVHNLEFPDKTFVEFGVEDYLESNTRFLLVNNNWSGLAMDGSAANIERIKSSDYFWRHSLRAEVAFIDAENVDRFLPAEPIGILHIDIDGMDYWVWKATTSAPVVCIIEFNSVFGSERAITVPYDPAFQRGKAHHSFLYGGASLLALCDLAAQKGYAFIGCNSAGNNAYFVRRDKLNDTVRETTAEAGFVESKFRESRDGAGRLNYLEGTQRLEAIRGLPVYNVRTGHVEPL